MIKKDVIDIHESDIGQEVEIRGKVIGKAPLKKPQIVTLSDGTGYIDIVGFSNRLERIKIGDFVKARGKLTKKRGNLEIRETMVEEISGDEKEKAENKIMLLNKKEAKIHKGEFLISSKKLEAMRKDLEKCANQIKEMLILGHPVIIRHHADCDGYSAAIALERAILPILTKRHRSKISALRFYRRAPSKTPFYDYSDAIRDITIINNDKERIGNKSTLLIITDMGSSAQNLLSIKKTKMYGCKIAIIDHHATTREEEKVIEEIADIYINPHRYGFDSNITAGMLGTEIARMIYKDIENIEFLPALAGIADHSSGEEMEKYLEVAKAYGYYEDYLKKLAIVVDFESFYMGHIESREMTDDLLGKDREKQTEIVNLIYPELEKLMKNHIKSAINYMNVIEKDNKKVGIINIKEISTSAYPGGGKIIGAVFSEMSQKGFLAILGEGDGFIIFRISEAAPISLGMIIEKLKKEFPLAMISGGGHDKAGTIKFLSAEQRRIRESIIKEFMKNNLKNPKLK